MKGLEFWGIEHGGAAAARSCQVSSRRIRSSQARLKTTPDATGNQIFKSCREVRRAKRWNRVTLRAQVPVLVSAMAEETIQQAERKPRVFHALGTAVPSAPAGVPDDPALPGLALLHRPEQFLAAFTPLLPNRLGSLNALESADFSVSRLHLFTAIAYLKFAYVEAAVRHNRDGKQVTDALLAEARRFAESEN